MIDDFTPEEPSFKNTERINIEKEMESSFLDYAMSVIVSRALPDVCDGLKPVHRRIISVSYTHLTLPTTTIV